MLFFQWKSIFFNKKRFWSPPLWIFKKGWKTSNSIFFETSIKSFIPENFKPVGLVGKKLWACKNSFLLHFTTRNWLKNGLFWAHTGTIFIQIGLFCCFLLNFSTTNPKKVIYNTFAIFIGLKRPKIPFFTIFRCSVNQNPQGGSANFGLLTLKIVQNASQ